MFIIKIEYKAFWTYPQILKFVQLSMLVHKEEKRAFKFYWLRK